METTVNKIVEYAPGLAIAAVAIGLFGYAIALMLAAFFSGKEGSLGAQLGAWFTTHPSAKSRHPVRSCFRLRHRRSSPERLSSLIECKRPTRI